MRWQPVAGRGDMLPPRPPMPDARRMVMQAGALYGRGENAYNFGYRLPNALLQWAEAANLRAMQQEALRRRLIPVPRSAGLPPADVLTRRPPPPRPVVVRPAPWYPQVR